MDIVTTLKTLPGAADGPVVPTFTAEIWAAFAFLAFAGVMTGLYSLAALVRDRTAVIDLKAKVVRLRKEYDEQTSEVVMEDDPEVLKYALEQVGARKAA
jgi:hypothetical protein